MRVRIRLSPCQKLAALIAVTMLCNCASKLVLNPAWKQDTRDLKTCAIVLHPEKIRLSYLREYEQLKADSVLMIKQNFMRCMKRQLRRNGYFSNVWFDDFVGEVPCTSIDIHAGYRLRMPVPNTRIETKKGQPDYLLILDTITIRPRIETSTAQETGQSSSPYCIDHTDRPPPPSLCFAGFLPSTYLSTLIFGQTPIFIMPVNPGQFFPTQSTWYGKGKTVLFRCPFILWDVKQRCAVRWGFLRVHGNEGFSINDWSSFADDVQKEIFTNMPLFRNTADWKKAIQARDTAYATGLFTRISPDEKKVGWIVTNTIVRLGRGATENGAGARVGGPLDSHRPALNKHSFMSTASGGEFSAPFCSTFCRGLSQRLPARQPCRSLTQLHFQDQLKQWLWYDNDPLDTLGDWVLAHANEDSLDYLVAVYSFFTYPDSSDAVEKISDYAVRLYCCLYDVKNNTMLLGYHEDVDNMLDHTKVKTFAEAIRIFGVLALFHLAAFLKL